MARPRKRFAPITAREWLEDMRRFNSRDADRATELLDLFSRAETTETILQKMLDGEKTGDGDFDGMIDRIDELEAIEAWTEQDEMMAGFAGDTTLERLKLAVAHATRLEAQSFALSELCMAAGVISKDDYTTDPLPLLAMFLPVD